MFSGIVERTAEVVSIRTDRQNKDFTLRADFCKELKIDQSIAHNGVCLTVVDITEDTYTVTAMKETLDRSNLGLLREGDLVNLERSMKPDALLDGGALRPGADKVLSILKMESVWLYAVTALDRAEAQALLRSAGIEGDFRGLLTEREAGCAVCSGTMLEKAMRRLRSQKADTVIFTGTFALVETAKKAGFRAVAVGGAAGEDEWRRMCALADYELPHYEDWLRLE